MKTRPVDIALTQVGVRESGGRNRGPRVDQYLKSVKLDPAKGGEKGYAWCAAFVYWCVREAFTMHYADMQQSGPAKLPIPCTAWVWDLLRDRARICAPKAGDIFVLSHATEPKDLPFRAHTGFVVSVDGEWIYTVEGNTNDAGSREGDGVYCKRRMIRDIYRFIDLEAPC